MSKLYQYQKFTKAQAIKTGEAFDKILKKSKPSIRKATSYVGQTAKKAQPTLKNVYKQPVSMKAVVDQSIRFAKTGSKQIIKKAPKVAFQAGKTAYKAAQLLPVGRGAKVVGVGGKLAWKAGKSLFKAFKKGYKKP